MRYKVKFKEEKEYAKANRIKSETLPGDFQLIWEETVIMCVCCVCVCCVRLALMRMQNYLIKNILEGSWVRGKYFIKKKKKQHTTYHHSRQLLPPVYPSGALGNAQVLLICLGHNCFSGNYFQQPDHIAWFLPSSKVTATTYSKNRGKGFFRNRVQHYKMLL